jgi:hypothetical protein
MAAQSPPRKNHLLFPDPRSQALASSDTQRLTSHALQAFVPFYDNYIKAQTDLLAQIRAERQKK